MTGGVPLPAGVGPGTDAPDAAPAPVSPLASTLEQCDRLLGEIGRREHRFSWLRAPGPTGELEWLAVDAYYPGNRLVVCCRSDPVLRALCAQEVPQHGLFLVTLSPGELTTSPQYNAELAGSRLADSGWSPRPVAAGERDPVPASAPLPEPQRAPVAGRRASAAVRPADPATSMPRSGREERFGVQIGLALIVIVLAEAYLGIVVLGVNRGDVILGLGLQLDACARVIGTIAAGHVGDHAAAWLSLVIGSPALAAADPPGAGEAEYEPARLARVTAVLALGVIALGVLTMVL
jgi:hypothetical protein